MTRTIDKFVIGFCKDCLSVLKDYDRLLHTNLQETKFPTFYKYDVKGVSVYSVTEPILKFIIFTSLCRKYQIWPEGGFYKGRELLDIALFSKPVGSIG